MVKLEGLEPSISPPQTVWLSQLAYSLIKWHKGQESNLRLSAIDTFALPLSYPNIKLADGVGIEPTIRESNSHVFPLH